MDAREIIDSIIDIEEAKNIDKSKVINIIKEGLIRACQQQFGDEGDYRASVNESTGQIDLIRALKIVENVEDEENEISYDEAKEYYEEAEIGSDLLEKLTLNSFGRLAINKMKSFIVREILSAERNSLFADYSSKIETLVTGTVKKIDRFNVYISLPRIEAKMPLDEIIPGEKYKLNSPIRALIIETRETKGDPDIILSRKSDKFLNKLLEFEVPEIEEGTVIVKTIARMPGIKSKIAVMTLDDKIDPVGACVGVKGSRIRTIIKELNNENIDIIQWSSDSIIFTQRVISPGVVIRAFKNEELKTMKMVVKDETYQKALGKERINLLLANKLTGWEIELLSESEFKGKKEGDSINPIFNIDGLTDNQKEKLVSRGFKSVQEIKDAGPEELSKIEGLGSKTVKKIFENIDIYLSKGEDNNND